MALYRAGIDTTAGPSRGSVIAGRGQLLVRVRLFDAGAVDDNGQPRNEQDVICDLYPVDARRLAAQLLEDAGEAEQITIQAGWWPR